MDEDIITIRLGCTLDKKDYKQVVEYLIACLNVRYPEFTKATLTKS